MRTYKVTAMNGAVKIIDCERAVLGTDGWLRFLMVDNWDRPVLMVKAQGMYMMEDITDDLSAFSADLAESDITGIPDLS